jgi:NTE family protein
MPLTTQDYVDAAKPTIEKLQAYFGEYGPEVSDVVDAKGHQYVNLVQEGGGVLGVALVGYTYVLEQMGIRFMKMAGTSAGAINTLVMAAVGDKDEAKSLKILEILNEKNLFDFVDGDPAAREMIRRVVTSEGYIRNLTRWAMVILVTLLVSVLGMMFALGSGRLWLIGIFALLLLVSGGFTLWAVLWIMSKRKKFYNADYGINPGRNFLSWISDILKNHGIQNLNDLQKHIEKVPEGGFRLKDNAIEQALKDLNDPKMEDFLAIITSDITNQMKVEFPRMWKLYWKDPSEVNPAYFVRASMSVPIFFQPFESPTIDAHATFDAWQRHAGVENLAQIPKVARFIDGGMISNFPINVFYNAKVKVPRLPTFGIMLDDEEAVDPNHAEQTRGSFLSFAAAMFNTVRFNYDKEFLVKHADFNKTIGRVDARGFNWLNFNLSDEEKKALFLRGVEGAAKFLMGPDYNQEVIPEPVQPTAEADSALESVSSRGSRSAAAPRSAKRGFSWGTYKEYREERKEKFGY